MRWQGYTYSVVSQHQHPAIDLVRNLVVCIARHVYIELYHACFVGGFFVLFLLVLDAFCDAGYDGNGDDGAAEEEAQAEGCHFMVVMGDKVSVRLG